MLLVPSTLPYLLKLIDPQGAHGGDAVKQVSGFATNALLTVTVPAPPGGRANEILLVFAGYATAAASGALTIPGQGNQTVTDIKDLPIIMGAGPFTTSVVFTLAAGGVGNVGLIVVYYRVVG